MKFATNRSRSPSLSTSANAAPMLHFGGVHSGAANAGLLGHLGKDTVGVAIELIQSIVNEIEVGITVVIVIANRAPAGPTRVSEARAFRDIRKRAVPLVLQ